MKTKTKRLVNKFIKDYGEIVAQHYGAENKQYSMAEDANTLYSLDLVLTNEDELIITTSYEGVYGQTYEDIATDDDDIKDWVKKWRSDMRRALRLWQMDNEQLEAIQDGITTDEEY